MLTITGLVRYGAPAKLRNVKGSGNQPRVPRITTRPALTNAERMRERRAKARAQGLCGVCAARWPRPGLKTCEGCLAPGRKKE